MHRFHEGEVDPIRWRGLCPSSCFFSAEKLLERTLFAGGWWRVGKAGDMVGIVGRSGRCCGTTGPRWASSRWRRVGDCCDVARAVGCGCSLGQWSMMAVPLRKQPAMSAWPWRCLEWGLRLGLFCRWCWRHGAGVSTGGSGAGGLGTGTLGSAAGGLGDGTLGSGAGGSEGVGGGAVARFNVWAI